MRTVKQRATTVLRCHCSDRSDGQEYRRELGYAVHRRCGRPTPANFWLSSDVDLHRP